MHRTAGSRIEVCRRLVGQYQRRTVHERARDRDALALAAGELARTASVLVGEADALHELVDPGAALGPAGRAEQEGILDVLACGQHGHEVEGLEDEAEAIAPDGREPPGRQMGNAQLTEPDLAAVGTIEAPDQVQQRGLPAARRTGERHELAGSDRERYVADGRYRRGAEPVTLADAECFGNGRCGHLTSSAARKQRQEQIRGRERRWIGGPTNGQPAAMAGSEWRPAGDVDRHSGDTTRTNTLG